MSKTQSIAPLVHDTSKSKPNYSCADCDKTFRSLYNFGVHRAMKHNDWSKLEEWAVKKGRKIWWET